MIHPESVAALAGTVPELRDWWDAYQMSADYDPAAPYTCMTGLALEVVDLRRRLADDDLSPLFAQVETRLLGADAEERALLIVGLLEDLQTASLNRGLALVTWEPLFGERTRTAWAKVIDLWSGILPPAEFNEFVKSRDDR